MLFKNIYFGVKYVMEMFLQDSPIYYLQNSYLRSIKY